MLFTTPMSVNDPAMGVMAGNNPTSPGTVAFGSNLYLFYTGNGGNGIFYTTTADGKSWCLSLQVNPPGPPGLGILAGTSPNAVFFGQQVYVFYSGSGQDGAWYTTTTDGSTWIGPNSIRAKIASMSLMAGTSPVSVVFGEALYLFYVDANKGGVFYVRTNDGTSWDNGNGATIPTQVAQGISASAAVFRKELYLFFADSEGRSFYKTFDGKAWSAQRQVSPEMTVYKGTSPSVFALRGDQTLYLAWAGTTSHELFIASSDDGIHWSRPEPQLTEILASQSILASTSPLMMEFGGLLYLFWTSETPGQSAGISYSSAPPPLLRHAGKMKTE